MEPSTPDQVSVVYRAGVTLDDWPDTPPLDRPRLLLEPLRVDHAEEMARLLDDPGLHTFIGGRPPSLAELRERYRRQAVGRPPDGTQRWCNWIARRRQDGRSVGFVQATVTVKDGDAAAEMAWVIAAAYQRRGYAREAAQTMATWLRPRTSRLTAHIHPHHDASAAVARAVGLTPTATVVDGEVRWEA